MANFFNPKEVVSAAPDAIALSAGASLSRPHPIAQQLCLRDIAEACARVNHPGRSLESGMSTLALGMTTSDFSGAIVSGLEPITIAAYHAQAEHLAFTVPQEVANFKPVPIRAVDMDVDLVQLSQGAEIQHFSAVLAGGARQAALDSFGRVFTLSRQAVVNNQMVDFGRLFSSAGSNAARLESRLVAAAMESNPTLDDGQVVFAAEFLNVLPGPDWHLDGPGLGVAMRMLRQQPTASGQMAGLRARHLVVEPSLEWVALSTLRAINADITVSVLTGLPTGRWYLLADPMVSPTVGVLRLHGAKDPVRVGRPDRQIQKDGFHMGVVADLGACLLRRTGIVRGGPSD